MMIFKEDSRFVYDSKDVMSATEGDIREELSGSEFSLMGASAIGKGGLYDHLLDKIPYSNLTVVTPSFGSDFNVNWNYICNSSPEKQKGIRIFNDYSDRIGSFEIVTKPNPLLSFGEGLSPMSAEGYRQFLTDVGMPSEYRTDKDVNILTEQGVSMVFLHIKIFTSTILDGSTLLKIEHPRDYFRANLPQYVKNAKEIFTPYLLRLNEVSAAVRSIGGTGTISGCTVEVFEKLKLVVDPVDLGLVLYRTVTKGIDYFDSFSQSEFLDDSVIESTPYLKDVLRIKPVSSNVPEHLTRKEINRMNAIADSLMFIVSDNMVRRWDDRILNKTADLAEILMKEEVCDGS